MIEFFDEQDKEKKTNFFDKRLCIVGYWTSNEIKFNKFKLNNLNEISSKIQWPIA